MKFTREVLKQLILEEYKKTLQEAFPFSTSGTIDTNKNQQPQQNVPKQSQQQKVDPKQTLKQNAGQQLKLLRFMRETLKQVKLPEELQNMIAHIKKAGTAEFLTQVLNVEKSIPVNIASVLTNPFELLQAIIEEIIKSSVRKANQKLAEGKVRLTTEIKNTKNITLKTSIDKEPYNYDIEVFAEIEPEGGGVDEPSYDTHVNIYDIKCIKCFKLQDDGKWAECNQNEKGYAAPGTEIYNMLSEEDIETLKQEVLNSAELDESELHFGHDPHARLEKHKRKEIKKHPKLQLSPEDEKKFKELEKSKK